MVEINPEHRKWLLEVAPRARRDFGPQWDTILGMFAVLVHSTANQRTQFCENGDVEHTMNRLSADYNMLEALGRVKPEVREQVLHVAILTHSLADNIEVDEDTAEMACSTIRAVCMRHVIDENGFSESDYNALTLDWSRVFNPV